MSEFGHATSHGSRVNLDQIRELPDLQRSLFSLDIVNPPDHWPIKALQQFSLLTVSFALNKRKKTFNIYQVMTVDQDMLSYPDQLFSDNLSYIRMNLRLFANTGEVKQIIYLSLLHTGTDLIMNANEGPAVYYMTFDIMDFIIN